MIQKFTISRDDNIYEAFPDVALTPSGRLVCVFTECTHHGDRSYTRVMLTDSQDRGRTWSPKRPLTEGTAGQPYFYDCARITQLKDGRLAILVNKNIRSNRLAEHFLRTLGPEVVAVLNKLFESEKLRKDILRSLDPESAIKVNELLKRARGIRAPQDCRNLLYFSTDEGATWSNPIETPALGIVPDKLLELDSGRWILSCHYKDWDFGYLIQRLWYSDDQGATWNGPVIVGRQEGLNLCEVSILPVEESTLVAFMRENSGLGWDCYKTISYDAGEHWSEPILFPLPGCHRPVAGWLQDGHILITHRFMQGGKGWLGYWTQNLFAALTDKESALALKRKDAWTRILPVDFDRSPVSDTGYTGWVQFDDGEIYIVNYIVDDAPNGQIRGYSLRMEDFLLESTPS